MASDVTIGVGLEVEDIDVKNINTKDVSKQLDKSLSSIRKTLKDVFSMPGGSKEFTNSITSSLTKLSAAEKKLLKANNTFNKSYENVFSTTEYNKKRESLQKQIKFWEDLWQKYQKQMQEFPGYDSLYSKMKQGYSIKDHPEMFTKQEKIAYNSVNDSTYASNAAFAQRQIKNLKSQLPSADDYIDSATKDSKHALISAYNNLLLAMREVEQEQQNVNNAMKDGNLSTDTYTQNLQNVKTTFSNIGNKAKDAFSKITGAIKNGIAFVRKFKDSIKKHFNDSEKSFKKLFGSLAMYIGGFRSLYYVIRRFRNLFINGFKQMALSIPDVNTYLSAFSTALNNLKGSLVAAFEPLAAVVVPILTAFINKLTEAINALAKFFGTLTGRGWYTFSGNTQDVAKNLGSASGSAKELERTIMGFDEINKLDDNSDSSGGGGSSSSSDLDGIWNLGEGKSYFAELLKAGWESADFTEVGKYIGEFMKNAFDKATNYLETTARDFIIKIGNILSSYINSNLAVEGLATSFGSMIGAALRTAVDGIHNFITKVDFDQVGTAILDSLRATIEKMSAKDENGNSGWFNLGESIKTAVEGVIQAVDKVLKDKDLQTKVGQAIADFFNGLDLGEVTWDLTGLLWSLLRALDKSFKTFDGNDQGIATALAWLKMIFLAKTLLNPLGNLFGSALTKVLTEKIASSLTKTGTTAAKAATEAATTAVEETATATETATSSSLASLGTKIGGFFSALGVSGTISLAAVAFSVVGLVGAIANLIIHWDECTAAANAHYEAISKTEEEIISTDGSLTQLGQDLQTNADGWYVEGKEIRNVAELLPDLTDAWVMFDGNLVQVTQDMLNNGTVAQDANGTWYQVHTDMQDKSTETAEVVSADADEVASSMEEMKTGAQEMADGFSDAATEVSTESQNMSTTVQTNLDYLDGNTYGYGLDAGISFANGINASLPYIADAADNMAETVAARTHFSEPDVGPLSNFHTFMPDMLKLMAKGINDNTDVALDALDSLTGQMSGRLSSNFMSGSIPSIARGAVLPASSSFASALGGSSNTMEQIITDLVNSTGLYDVILSAVSSAMENAPKQTIENKVYLDSKQIKAGQTRLARSMGV